MGSPSPPDPLESARDRLGELQALAGDICHQTSSRRVSRLFSHFSHLIWQHYGQSACAIERTCKRCYEYLEDFERDELIDKAPECEDEIERVYEEIDSLYESICEDGFLANASD